jgi:hypothetical protein
MEVLPGAGVVDGAGCGEVETPLAMDPLHDTLFLTKLAAGATRIPCRLDKIKHQQSNDAG